MKFLKMIGQGFKDVLYLISHMEMYLLCFLDAASSFPWIEIYMIIIWSITAVWAFQWYIWYPLIRKI